MINLYSFTIFCKKLLVSKRDRHMLKLIVLLIIKNKLKVRFCQKKSCLRSNSRLYRIFKPLLIFMTNMLSVVLVNKRENT